MRSKTPGLTKYMIGLGVLLLFVVGLVVWLALQAGAVRSDNKTYKAADKIAMDLESYISAKNKIPAKLTDATKEPVPATISYTKLSDSRYKFCVTYESASSDFSAADAQSKILSSAYGIDDPYQDSEEDTYLYVSSSHKKGQNCQTIKPYISTYNDDLYNSNCVYDSSLGAKAYDEYFNCIDNSASGTRESSLSI